MHIKYGTRDSILPPYHSLLAKWNKNYTTGRFAFYEVICGKFDPLKEHLKVVPRPWAFGSEYVNVSNKKIKIFWPTVTYGISFERFNLYLLMV